MTQDHCLECPAWEELRRGLEMSNIDDMVVFFRKLLLERAKLEVKDVSQKTASHDSISMNR